jgi:hypothetical protein
MVAKWDASQIMIGTDPKFDPFRKKAEVVAAIARSRQAALATRNTIDLDHCGSRIINPSTTLTLE